MLTKTIATTAFLYASLASMALAHVQAPAVAGAGAPCSDADRIYTGDQTSNTITVIAACNRTVLGTINLGDPRLTNELNPQYVRAASSHGLGFSRDGALLASLSVLSNTLTVIRAADNTIVSQTSVDRGPHEAFFAADNRTVWVGTRGVGTISIVDGLAGKVLGRIATADGPSKVLFSPDGSEAYVNHIRAPVVAVVDVASRTVKYNITGLADKFSSDMMLSADGGRLWAAHKMTGQVSVIDVQARKVVAVLNSGPETNHPNFAVVNGTTLGFVTVASLNHTKVYAQPSPQDEPRFLTAVAASGIEPHGMWPSPDNKRMYVLNEHSDTLDEIDTHSLRVVHTLQIGQESQALVYVAGAAPDAIKGQQNLGSQGLGLKVVNKLIPVHREGGPENATASALITVRQAAGLDMFQVVGRNLKLNGSYTASAVCAKCSGHPRIPLVSFNATSPTPTGCGGAPQVLAFFKFLDVYDLHSLEVVQNV